MTCYCFSKTGVAIWCYSLQNLLVTNFCRSLYSIRIIRKIESGQSTSYLNVLCCIHISSFDDFILFYFIFRMYHWSGRRRNSACIVIEWSYIWIVGLIIDISLYSLFYLNSFIQRLTQIYSRALMALEILAISQTQSDDRVGYESDTSSGHKVQVICSVHTHRCLLDVWCEERDLAWASCHDIILTIGPKMGVEFTLIELRYVYSLGLDVLLRHTVSHLACSFFMSHSCAQA